MNNNNGNINPNMQPGNTPNNNSNYNANYNPNYNQNYSQNYNQNYNYGYNYNQNYDPNNNPNVPPQGSRNGSPKKPKSRFGIGILVGVLITIAALLVAAVLGVFVFFNGMKKGTTDLNYQEKLDTIQSYLDMYFLWDIDEEAMEDSLAEGLLAGTGDKYAQYYSKKEFDNLMEEISGSYGGIGVSIIENDDGMIEVVQVFEGSPAEAAGIQAKDIIIEADGITEIRDVDHLVELVRGEPGTTVDLVVKRDDKEIPVTVERQIIEMELITYEMLEDHIGYIRLSEFETIAIEQFNQALDDLESQGMTSLIIDIRDNPGGDYDTVISLADRVLPEGKITTVIDKNGTSSVETSDEEHQINIPMVVLINGNSASASELFSGAIKDYGIATMIGETTFGKGIIQSIYRLPDGSGMKFTTQEYLTPNGNHIHEIGVSPDIEVAIPEEAYEDGVVTREEDVQLQTAIDFLKDKTK